VAATHFDKYYRYEQLTTTLRDYAEQFPALLRLSSIGHSHEGRDIWLVTVTCFATGADTDKPALWVDANIHSAELVSSMAALKLIDTLVHGYGGDAEITRALDSRVFYIVPRVNPDGAEWALADTPRLVRSSVRPWPFPEQPVGGLRVEDIDGDGRILSMRIRDDNGPWKICPEEPRLLVRREPTEIGGQYYRLLPEGRLEDDPATGIRLQPLKEGLDLNRNFPVRWRGEHEQTGAGPYPGSEPEVRALLDFVTGHTNICCALSLHSYSGVLLRPYSFQDDTTMPAEDLWTYDKIGARGTELTGYPHVSAYAEFRYHPQQVITGAMDDWFYEELGRFAWTIELWSPQRQAGIGEYKFIDWYREHPLADDLAMLKWSDEQLQGRGYVDWYPFEHPQLGTVEIGGWEPLYTFWNPPPAQLDTEISRLPAWLVWQALISPRLELLESGCKPVGDGHWQVSVTVQNTGWLPSYITRLALDKKLVRGVLFEITLPEQARLLQGEQRSVAGQLEGRAHKPSSPTGWAGQVGDITDERLHMNWLVEAVAGTDITVTARHDRAGSIQAKIRLE